MIEENQNENDETVTKFFRCRTCGDFVREEDAVNKIYCSNICARRYIRCINCGRYFIKVYKDQSPLCSPECEEYFADKIKYINRVNLGGNQ